MSNLDLQNIDVFNYSGSKVFIETSSSRYKINEAKSDGTPALISLPLSELKYIASNTEVFNIGILTFDEAHKEEIYKELRVVDWENILSDKQIEDILLNPTQEGLQRILDIKNPAYFDRVRAILHKLTTSGSSVTARVVDIISKRYQELSNRIKNTRIQLVKRDTVKAAAKEDVDEVKAQNQALQAQMAEMKRMIAELTKQSQDTEEVEEEIEEAQEVQEEVEEAEEGNDVAEDTEIKEENNPAEKEQRKRGRPAGSKNKK